MQGLPLPEFIPSQIFQFTPAMYPELPEWRSMVERFDPRGVMRSDLARRLALR